MTANGRLDASTLVQAPNGAPGQLLEAQTALQLGAMVSAAALDGVDIRPQSENDGIASCYRSIDNQEFAKAKEAAGGATAAEPGDSNHGWGTAVDFLITAQNLPWLRANAARFGFDNVQGAASGEDWHWVRTRTINLISLNTAQKRDSTVQIVSSDNRGQVELTEVGGAYAIDNSMGAAVYIRQVYPATDFHTDDNAVDTLIADAWHRANFFNSALVGDVQKRIDGAIAAAKAQAQAAQMEATK